MKKIILNLTFLVAFSSSFAQIVPNGGFENWTLDYYYDEPNFGITSNLQCFYNLQMGNVQKTNDAFAGNFAARLVTMQASIDTIPGIILVGTPSGNSILGGIPINARPDSLKCYAKFNIQPNDTATIVVGFRKTGFIDPIGVAELTFTGVQNSYLEYKALIFWADSFTVPDTLFAIFASSRIGNSPIIPGSELFIDNVGFTGAVGTPNSDFENWTTVESLEPDNWWTPNFALINQTPCVTQSTDAHTGQYALRIENVLTDFGDTLGFASNGNFTNNNFNGGMAIIQNPIKVTGYYKYSPIGNDTALVGVYISKFDATFGISVDLDSSLIKLPAAATYTYFEVPLYYNGWPIADSLNITFASGNFQDDISLLVPGSVLLVDDIEVLYNPVSVQDFNFQKTSTVFPNPAQNVLYIKMTENATNQSFKLFDAKGTLVFEGNCHYQEGRIASMDISEVPQGLYFYQINNGKSSSTGKLTIQK
jgi:hypothetical protein